jgi:hypothetical protein
VANVPAGPLQALLEVYSAEIVGGDGRFAFTDGFSPAEVGGDPVEYSIAFDDGGAATDSLYTAVLTLSTRDDQDVYGAYELDPLEVVLTAYVEPGTSVPEGGTLELSLDVGSRNPFTEQAVLSLTLPEASEVRATVYDVRGRAVAEIASGRLPSGTHAIVWDGRDAEGRNVASGIYFVRVEVGSWTDSRKLVRLR